MCESTFIRTSRDLAGLFFLCRLDVIRIKLVDYHYLRHYRDFPDLYTHQTNGICQNFTSDAAVIYPELREQEKTIGTIICLYKSMNRSMHSGSIIFSTKHLRPDVFIGRIIDTTYRLKSKRPVLLPENSQHIQLLIDTSVFNNADKQYCLMRSRNTMLHICM